MAERRPLVLVENPDRPATDALASKLGDAGLRTAAAVRGVLT